MKTLSLVWQTRGYKKNLTHVYFWCYLPQAFKKKVCKTTLLCPWRKCRLSINHSCPGDWSFFKNLTKFQDCSPLASKILIYLCWSTSDTARHQNGFMRASHHYAMVNKLDSQISKYWDCSQPLFHKHDLIQGQFLNGLYAYLTPLPLVGSSTKSTI